MIAKIKCTLELVALWNGTLLQFALQLAATVYKTSLINHSFFVFTRLDYDGALTLTHSYIFVIRWFSLSLKPSYLCNASNNHLHVEVSGFFKMKLASRQAKIISHIVEQPKDNPCEALVTIKKGNENPDCPWCNKTRNTLCLGQTFFRTRALSKPLDQKLESKESLRFILN